MRFTSPFLSMRQKIRLKQKVKSLGLPKVFWDDCTGSVISMQNSPFIRRENRVVVQAHPYGLSRVFPSVDSMIHLIALFSQPGYTLLRVNMPCRSEVVGAGPKHPQDLKLSEAFGHRSSAIESTQD